MAMLLTTVVVEVDKILNIVVGPDVLNVLKHKIAYIITSTVSHSGWHNMDLNNLSHYQVLFHQYFSIVHAHVYYSINLGLSKK